MTLLKPNPSIPANRLTWIPEDNRFAGEISSIGGRFGRVWDDSCDEGLTLVSRYPDRDDIVFAVGHVERDHREGDLLWWDLEPVNRRQASFGIRIFND